MKKMMCLAFALLLILSLMHVGAAEESFLYRNAFSFGMSREEAEAAAETLYPEEDGWHKSTNSYVIDEAHETINYDSSVNGSEVAFAFST